MSNVFSFTGTVGRDAEVRSAPSGVAILNVTVANNIGFGDKQQTLWVRVVVFGKRAEGKLVDYLKKGQLIFVSGELTQSEYKANDGTTKTSLELNATIIDLIGKKSEGQDAPQQTQQAQRQARPTQAPANDLPYADDFDDSIPF